jgi:GTP-binding protein
MFRDEAEIEVIAGDGGDGRVSMRREKFVPFGGPDGGDGGEGGSVILRADANLNSLLPIGRRFRYAAESGEGGLGSNKAGRSAENLVLPVPVGTQIFDRERGNLLRDLKRHGAEVVIAQGGRGGQGNARFASATRQTPRHATKGRPGERRRLRLELKLFAEVGLVGLPNAGKSTLLATVTAATPKIADYPFTTLAPQVGIAQVSETQTLVIADLPGLIEGASEGIGLGHRFLKHVERCQAILQLVDVSGSAEMAPAEAFRVIDAEVRAFSELLAKKERVVAASKCENEDDEARAAELERTIGHKVWRLSALQHKGLQEILRECHTRVHAAELARS